MSKNDNKIYVTSSAHLMSEWDWEKNVQVTPSSLSSGSHTKVWWKCSLGHSWLSAVSKRFIGQECPFCSGKKAWKGYNDLATTNPELAAEWDFSKNEVPIYTFRPMSNKKVWWLCDKGHSWSAVIAKRVSGEKCPVCQGKQILTGFNDLSTTHAFLVREWDHEKNLDIAPIDISKGSTAKVWWKCRRNHSWQAAIYSRASGVGCPHCAKEIQTSFPEKAIYFYVKQICPDAIANYRFEQLYSFELDIFVPSLRMAIEYDGEKWHQTIEKDLQKNKLCAEMGFTLIRIREPACPTLSDNLSICITRESKKTGLDTAISRTLAVVCKMTGLECSIDVDLERDSADILELLYSSEKENSILDRNPQLANEWDYQKNGTLLPNMVTVGSDKKVWWLCPRRHSYQAALSSRSEGKGCPICSGRKVLKGYNDFESRYPQLAQEWDYEKNDITPDMVTYGSDKKFWWKCNRDHSYECSINNRRSGQGCYYCSGKRVLPGFNDISTTHPDVAKQWCADLNDIQPTEISAGSQKRVWWECDVCGHHWVSYIYNRCLNGSNCPHCSGRVKSITRIKDIDFSSNE